MNISEIFFGVLEDWIICSNSKSFLLWTNISLLTITQKDFKDSIKQLIL